MKLIVLVVGTFLALSCTAQSEWTEVCGKVIEKGITEVELFEVENGRLKAVAKVQVDKDSQFGFLIRPASEGFYALGSARVSHPLYLKAGDQVNVELTPELLRFVGKNTPENVKLGEWEQLCETVVRKSLYFFGKQSTYRDFFPEQVKLFESMEAFRASIHTSNRKFNEALRRKCVYDFDFYALNFLYTPRAIHPQDSFLPACYQTILAPEKFTDDFLLSLPYGNRYIALCAMWNQRFSKKEKPQFDETLDLLTCDRLKGEYLISTMERFKSYFQFQDAMENYGKYLTTASQKDRGKEIRRKLFQEAPKGEAINFTYPDQNGKMTSLSDFKGKVIVVDVWATWCEPCKQQFPYLKKLEKELHGKNVVFIGVSLDKQKDQAKWKKMVEDEGLGGVQLFADGFSKIAKDYDITGIPRFMVFDKQGKVVDIRAPRPSQPELKKMIEIELKK